MMGIRRRIIEYSRGNDLCFLWFLFKLKNRVKNRFLYDILVFMMSRSAHRHGGYIGPDTAIKNIPSLPHGLHGIFISRYAKIGENCRIYQNVTIGEVNREAPTIGDNCMIGAGAVIVGNVRIGNNVRIGAGAVVVKDISDNCTVVAQSARLIKRDSDTSYKMGRAWIEISRENLHKNIDTLQSLLPAECKLMPAIKANAYGHGAVIIARELNAHGIKAFCVATAIEGMELRENGIEGEILVLGYTHPNQFSILIKYNLIQTVVDYFYAKLLDSYGIKMRVHLKIDTGMHRLGVRCENFSEIVKIFE